MRSVVDILSSLKAILYQQGAYFCNVERYEMNPQLVCYSILFGDCDHQYMRPSHAGVPPAHPGTSSGSGPDHTTILLLPLRPGPAYTSNKNGRV